MEKPSIHIREKGFSKPAPEPFYLGYGIRRMDQERGTATHQQFIADLLPVLEKPSIHIREKGFSKPAPEPFYLGYVYIYVANETQADFNVFFDDVEIAHNYNPIVQARSYYPFGETFLASNTPAVHI